MRTRSGSRAYRCAFSIFPIMLEFILLSAPFGGCGCHEISVLNSLTTSISRRVPAKNKNSTPARSPEVLSAAHAVCCDLIHGRDSIWSRPWDDRRNAAKYLTIIVVRYGNGQS